MLLRLSGGLYFIFFVLQWAGLNKPPPLKPRAERFMLALMETTYMLPLIKWTQGIFGMLLILNIAPIACALVLFPISLSIFLFQIFLNQSFFNVGNLIAVLHFLALMLIFF